jgi:pimeloyl-ACP methyl ester carboxylesterase
VAINTLFFSDYRWHFWARVWRTPFLGELSMAVMNRPMFVQELRRGSGKRMTEEHIEATWALMTPHMKKEVLRLYRATNPENFKGWEDDFLALTARKPTMVIWGDKDPYLSSRYAERFNALTRCSTCGGPIIWGRCGLSGASPAIMTSRFRTQGFIASSSAMA